MHARGCSGAEKKVGKNARSDPARGWPVLRYSCSQIIYDPQNELPHALCETQLVRLTRTLLKGERSGGLCVGEKKIEATPCEE